MFSKKYLFISKVFISLFSLTITSCGLKLGEKPAQNDVVEFKADSCLEGSIKSLKRMFKAEARDEEITPALNCISTTIQTFSSTVQGQNEKYFTMQELTYFLNKNIITHGSKIPDSLALEIMKLKVSLLGGVSDQITKSELSNLRFVIANVTTDFVNINKYMPLLTENWNYNNIPSDQKELKFNEARIATQRLFDNFFAQFSKNKTEYDINFAVNLIKEFLLYTDASADKITKIESYRSLAVSVCRNLISTNNIIKSTDWPIVSKALNSTLFLILRSEYFTKHENDEFGYDSTNKLSRYGSLIADIANSVYSVLNSQSYRNLNYSQLSELFNVVFKTFKIDLTFDETIVKDFSFLKDALIDNPKSSERSNSTTWNKVDFLLLTPKMDQLFKSIGILTSITKQMSLDSSWKTNYVVFSKYESDFDQELEKVVPLFDGHYDLQYLKSLLFSFKNLGLIKTDDFLTDYDKYYNLILDAKTLVTSTEGSILSPDEIKNILILSGRSYFHYLEYKNYLESIKYKSEDFANLFLNILPKIKTTLIKSLDYNINGFFTSGNLIHIYATFCSDLNHKPIMTNQSLSIVLSALWSNILIDPIHRINGKILPGFNLEALNNIYKYAEALFVSNSVSKTLLSDVKFPSQNQLTMSIQDLTSKTSDPLIIHNLIEMENAFSGPVPMTFQNNYLKILDPNSNTYNYEDIILSNLCRVISRILFQSYSDSIENIKNLDQLNSQLSQSEVQVVFDQLKSIIFELDLISAKNFPQFVTKRFQEANLFVSRANGDEFISFFETHDIIMHLLSGTARAKKIHDSISSYCLTPAALPLTRNTEIFDLCLLDVYYKFNAGFDYLPGYLTLKTSLDEIKYKEYSLHLLTAAGYKPTSDQIVILDDADNFPHIVQYVEMMFARFDTDNNGELIKEEALRAFPVFKNTIKKAVKGISGGNSIKDSQLPGVFIYFLKYGRAPKSFIEKIEFMTFISDEKKWDIHSTRYDVGKVFQYIAENTN